MKVLAEVGEVLDDQRLTGVHAVRQAGKKARAFDSRQDRAEAGTQKVLATLIEILTRGGVDLAESEIGDVPVVVAHRLQQRLRIEHRIGGRTQQGPRSLAGFEVSAKLGVVGLPPEDPVEESLQSLSGIPGTHRGVGEDDVIVQGGGEHSDRLAWIDTDAQFVVLEGTLQDRFE